MCMYIYIYMYIFSFCLSVCMYVCMHARLYACKTVTLVNYVYYILMFLLYRGYSINKALYMGDDCDCQHGT